MLVPIEFKGGLKHMEILEKNEIDQVTWIELIPISETRNYVQRVLEGIYMYGAILNKEKNVISDHIKFF